MKFDCHCLQVVHLAEPSLTFRFGQPTCHPKDGLHLYGPFRSNADRKSLSLGVIGTRVGLTLFREWSEMLLKKVDAPEPKIRDKENRLHHRRYLGLEALFGISYNSQEFIEYEVSCEKIDKTTRLINHCEAVSKTVEIFLRRIRDHDSNEERRPDIWILVIPELIYSRCTPMAKRSGLELETGEYEKHHKQPVSLPLFDGKELNSESRIFADIPDFHRQIKAKLLGLGYTSQIVRETTLFPKKFLNKAGNLQREVQDGASIAWNFATGLYYKTQATPPWKVAGMREGVCYVGLVFKKIPNDARSYACCAAQMFLSEGDGLVFRGANGPWKTEDGEYHLERTEARKLVSSVMESYRGKFGRYPSEIFIHGRTNFTDDEWDGFSSAVSKETNIIGVRIKSTSGQVKLFPEGTYPVMRGTAMILDSNSAFLFTTGYVPLLDTYMGPETPNPVGVKILRWSGKKPNISSVLSDIMSLTKLNYNACNLGDGLPVTILFADRVGDILAMGSAMDSVVKQPFKFYV